VIASTGSYVLTGQAAAFINSKFASPLFVPVGLPDRPRPFKVPFAWIVAPLGAFACLFVMIGLPRQAWERFFIWLVIGGVLYAAYGYRNSHLRRAA